MENNEPQGKQKPDIALMQSLVESLIARQNEQAQTTAQLRTMVEALEARMDEATHMTSDEYGQQVIEQIMAAMPSIQEAARKSVKRVGRR